MTDIILSTPPCRDWIISISWLFAYGSAYHVFPFKAYSFGISQSCSGSMNAFWNLNKLINIASWIPYGSLIVYKLVDLLKHPLVQYLFICFLVKSTLIFIFILKAILNKRITACLVVVSVYNFFLIIYKFDFVFGCGSPILLLMRFI